MLSGLTGWHALLILAVILLLFGAAKLPGLARSLGQSARAFQGEMKQMKAEAKPIDRDETPPLPGSAARSGSIAEQPAAERSP